MASRDLPSLFSGEMAENPFFQSLQKEIDRVFDRFREPGGSKDFFKTAKGQVLPALDIAESEKSIEITAELPGVKEEDLEVTITDGVLTLKGEKSVDREEKEKDYHVVERAYGSFQRSVPLGFTPPDDKVEGHFKDGVLTLKIEKPAEAATKTQKVKIKKA